MSRRVGSKLANFYVGDPPDHFAVHLKLICDGSKFFNAAFNGAFAGGTTHEMKLPEDDPAVFGVFAEWLYSQTLVPFIPVALTSSNQLVPSTPQCPASHDPANPAYYEQCPRIQDTASRFTNDVYMHICCQARYISFSPEELRLTDYSEKRRFCDDHGKDQVLLPKPKINDTLEELTVATNTQYKQQFIMMKLLFFAEKICWTELSNHAMSAYMKGWINIKSWPPDEHICQIYEHTHDSSILRKYVSECAVYRMKDNGRYTQFFGVMSNYPGYLHDVLSALERYHYNPIFIIFSGNPHEKEKCTYHDHDLTTAQPWNCSAQY